MFIPADVVNIIGEISLYIEAIYYCDISIHMLISQTSIYILKIVCYFEHI